MSIEAVLAEQRVRDMQDRVHHFVSSVGNALERIGIHIDEDELDDAKREIEDLRDAVSRISDDEDAAERKELIETIYSRRDGYESMGDLAIDMMELVPIDVLRDYKTAGDPPEEDDEDYDDDGNLRAGCGHNDA
jgi:hypothetical protein